MNKYAEDKNNLILLANSQQTSASSPLSSVWVEASAGTGKTKVLSDRVLRLLLKNVNPSKILCLTYTKAAAVEMNERIAKRLSSWAVDNDDNLKNDLIQLLGDDFNKSSKLEIIKLARTLFAQQLDALGGMKIQTIHSFCQDILKRFPIEAGISPYFEVLDDRNSKEILQNIKSDLLKNTDAHSDTLLGKYVHYLVNNISEFKFPEVMNMITENRNKIDGLLKKYGNIDEIVSTLENKLNVSSSQTPQNIKQLFFNNINEELIDEIIDALKYGGTEDNKFANILLNISFNNFDITYYEEYKKVFLTQSGEIRKKLASKGAIEHNTNIIEKMLNEAARILSTENDLKNLNVLQSTIAVLHISKNIIDAYNEYKTIYSVLDYEDLIIKTHNLLENSTTTDWVLFKLDGGIEHILIDEAQDTSPSQWSIIKALTEEFFAGIGAKENVLPRTVFVVGDRKQSIYSFQGADPKEFDKMYKYFEKKALNFSKVHLDVSFRSTKAIMDCVNILFDTPLAKKGVLPENEKINHRPFRLGDGGVVEILPLVSATEETKDTYNWHIPIERSQKISPSNTLARNIAQNIKQMVENKDILSSKNRPIQYGDFMFLVQQRNSFVEEFVRACKEIGVNVGGVDKLKLLEQIAVQDLISLGKFLLLPNDDLSLAEVLKSPLFGLDDDDLFELCYKRKSSLFDSLNKNNKFDSVTKDLKTLLNMVGYTRPLELFNYVLVKMNGRKNFISRLGIEVEDVLDEFINLTILFEQKHNPTLSNFINWVIQDEVIVQKQMEQGDVDTVKIMTVHGSKGLQAPIVILADTTKIKNKSRKSEFLWEDELFYFPLSSSDYNEKCNTIKEKNLEADFDEYRRLLYVALTRAEDRLYIAGYTKDKSIKEESWYSLLKNNILSNIELGKNDERTVYQIKQENPVANNLTHCEASKKSAHYNFALEPAPFENPLAKPYTPSKDKNDDEIISSPLEDNGKFYKRGTAIHKLLQYISKVDEPNRENASILFLQKELPELSLREHQNISEEVLALCKKYSDIFSKNSYAEVPIIGEVNGRIVSSKIDRLVIEDDRVIIVDYKTNRPAAKNIEEVPLIYINQLNTYKELVKRIYPDKKIDAFLLWTNTCNMMKV